MTTKCLSGHLRIIFLFFCYFHIFALNLKYSQKLETAAVKTLGGNDI